MTGLRPPLLISRTWWPKFLLSCWAQDLTLAPRREASRSLLGKPGLDGAQSCLVDPFQRVPCHRGLAAVRCKAAAPDHRGPPAGHRHNLDRRGIILERQRCRE